MANKGANSANQLTQVYQAMVWATQNGAHVINCSWSSSYYSSTYQNMVTGMWNDGVVIVASAGNHGTTQPHYPGAYDNVVGVAATNQSDHKAGFSAYGDWVSISAPGTGIYSTWSTGSYINSDGTSMSSPITAGTVGLLKAANPTWSPAELVETLLSTADNIDAINPSYAGLLGSGRVNAYAALAAASLPNFVESDRQITITDDDGDGVLNPGESFDLVITLDNSWAAATNVVVTLTGDEYFTMVDSIADFGDIGHNQSGDNSSDPFQIYTVAGMPPVSSILNMHISADGYETDLEFEIATSLFQANFPVTVPGLVESSPVFVDFDHDGAKEMIIGASDNKVYVFNINGENKPGWPKSVSQNVVTGPAVGSLAGDGMMQVVATTKDGKVYAWNTDGSDVPGFPITIGGTMYSGAMLIDLDGDQNLEIVVGSFATNSIHVFNHDGSYFPGWPLTTANKWYGSPASGDIDDDGLMEIVYAGFDSLVHVYNADASEVSGFPVNVENVVWASVAVGDVDGDNFPEIMTVNSSGGLYQINHDGSIANGFPVASSGLVRCAPSLGDVDGNGSLDIVFGGNDGILHAFNASGNYLTGFPLSFDGTLTGTPVIGDISGDGDADIIVGSSDAILYAVDGNGNFLSNFPFETSAIGQISGTAALGDFDDDGDMEIAFGLKYNGPNIMVVDYKSNASAEDLQWPNFGRDIWRSHNMNSLVVSADDDVNVPVAFSLEQNYPNPFNAQTTIRFSLGTPGDAELSIFDLLGRNINVLNTGELDAGTHSIIWDGTNKSGQVVSSGIYFYRLKSSDGTLTRRMVLLK
jgi:hypothetical protein